MQSLFSYAEKQKKKHLDKIKMLGGCGGRI